MPLSIGVAVDILAAYRREYAELTDNWARIESKAQGTAVVAGALVSATIALVTSARFSVPRDLVVFFPLIAVALFISACFSWKAIKIGVTTLPSPGDDVRDFAVDAHTPLAAPTYQAFKEAALQSQIESWSEACADLHAEAAKKADAVLEAQCWLFVAGILAILFVLGYALDSLGAS